MATIRRALAILLFLCALVDSVLAIDERLLRGLTIGATRTSSAKANSGSMEPSKMNGSMGMMENKNPTPAPSTSPAIFFFPPLFWPPTVAPETPAPVTPPTVTQAPIELLPKPFPPFNFDLLLPVTPAAPATLAPIHPETLGPATTAPVTTAPIHLETSAPVTPPPVDPAETPAPVTSAPITRAPSITTAPITTAPDTTAPLTIPPITTAPITTAPVTIAPGTIDPGTIDPGTGASVTIAPGTIAPGTMAPVTIASGTIAPATIASGTIAPATIAPGTIAPAIIAPGTIAPVTIAPATIAPGTIAPGTIAPATIAPDTIAPDTIAPATIAPATIAPATKVPTVVSQTPPTEPSQVTTFCILADAPYDERMRLRLIEQVDSVYEDCEFVAHLGDIRSARQFDTCVEETYTNASLIMARSSKPVFMMIGDNEWNDCPNHEEALGFWHQEFDHFTDTHWPAHGFNVSTQPGRIENRYFVHKQTLFINLNIVGGRVHNATEWNDRLTGNFNWTRDLIQTHVLQEEGDANAVVIMAHATNSPRHRQFFHSMRSYIRDSLKNTVPILYLNGDTHRWNYEQNYFDQPSWLRITLEGEARQPILKVMVDGSSTTTTAGFMNSTINETFSYDRGLSDFLT